LGCTEELTDECRGHVPDWRQDLFSGHLETPENGISNSPTHVEIDGAITGEIQIAG
jgi:hypothetical protein